MAKINGKSLWRQWKKGIIVGLGMTLVGFLLALVIGAGISLSALLSGAVGIAGAGVLGLVAVIVIVPIVRGMLIEFVTKKIK